VYLARKRMLNAVEAAERSAHGMPDAFQKEEREEQ